MKHQKIKFEWEEIDTNTQRAKVIGGWIITYSFMFADGVAMQFIPDPLHTWQIDKGEAC